MRSIDKKLIESGVRISDSRLYEEDMIWSRYSHDKVDIGEELAKVIRTLTKALPLSKAMRALSLGSSAEPQFRILETSFRAGLYLLDIDDGALSMVRERIRRQHTDHVATVRGDYNAVFLSPKNTRAFLKTKLDARKMHLITFHHSMYYCRECDWGAIFENLYGRVLAPQGAMHAVLMASKSDDRATTTWLYNYFAGKFFGCCNDQDLHAFRGELKTRPLFKKAQLLLTTHHIYFYVHDFLKFMAVVWMILLYPDVHKYTLKQREEITEFVYREFWLRKKPLIQAQDHLVIYKGIRFKGLV